MLGAETAQEERYCGSEQDSRLSLSPGKLPGMRALLQNRGLSSSGKFGLLEDLKIQCGSPCHPVPESRFCRFSLPPVEDKLTLLCFPQPPLALGPVAPQALFRGWHNASGRAASPPRAAAPSGTPSPSSCLPQPLTSAVVHQIPRAGRGWVRMAAPPPQGLGAKSGLLLLKGSPNCPMCLRAKAQGCWLAAGPLAPGSTAHAFLDKEITCGVCAYSGSMQDFLATTSASISLFACEVGGIGPPPPLSSHMIISQGRKPPGLPESEELPRPVGWRCRARLAQSCGGGSQLSLRATLAGGGPEAYSPILSWKPHRCSGLGWSP